MLTLEPARLCALDAIGLGSLRVGAPGDVTVVDPDERWTIDASKFAGLSRKTPFDGRPVCWRAIATVVAGDVRMERRAAAAV